MMEPDSGTASSNQLVFTFEKAYELFHSEDKADLTQLIEMYERSLDGELLVAQVRYTF